MLNNHVHRFLKSVPDVLEYMRENKMHALISDEIGYFIVDMSRESHIIVARVKDDIGSVLIRAAEAFHQGRPRPAALRRAPSGTMYVLSDHPALRQRLVKDGVSRHCPA